MVVTAEVRIDTIPPVSSTLSAVKLSPPVRALLIALAVIAVLWIVLGLAATNILAPGS